MIYVLGTIAKTGTDEVFPCSTAKEARKLAGGMIKKGGWSYLSIRNSDQSPVEGYICTEWTPKKGWQMR